MGKRYTHTLQGYIQKGLLSKETTRMNCTYCGIESPGVFEQIIPNRKSAQDAARRDAVRWGDQLSEACYDVRKVRVTAIIEDITDREANDG